MTRKVTRFILVDDDPIHLKLSAFQIGTQDEGITVTTFLQAAKALEYLRAECGEKNNLKRFTIIMVNVNMYGLSGWDFLDAYATLEPGCRTRMELFFVSASIDPADMKRARANPHVKDYLVKPLSQSDFRKLILSA